MKKRWSAIFLILAVVLLIASCSDVGLVSSSRAEGVTSRLLIPAGAEIVSAELYLYAYGVYAWDAVNVHRITAGWDEYTVTWGNFNGAYSSEVIDTVTVSPGWQSFDITPFIQGWLDGAYINNGLLLDQAGLYKFNRYYSRESALKPYVQLTYRIQGNLLVDDPEVVTADTYIWALAPTSNKGSSDTLYTGYISDFEKQTLIKFDLEEEPGDLVGTGTPGYWKNHPEAWPVEEITIGGIVYDKDLAIEQMSLPIKKDKWYTMFRTLVAAKLNVLNGTPDIVADVIAAADQWMETYHHLLADGTLAIIRAKSDAWAEGSEYQSILDDYNNGLLEGAPSRDALEE